MSKLILFGDSALEIYAHLALRPSDSIAFRGKPPAETAPTTAGIAYLAQLFPWLTQPAHILVFNPDDRRQKLARCHVAPESVIRSPLYRIANGIFLPGPELALIQAARGKRIEEIAYLGTILCSTFCFAEDSSTLLARAPLTFPADIAKIKRPSPRRPWLRSCAERRSLDARKCSVAPRVRPRARAAPSARCGGYGLPQPSFNEPINLAEANKKLADRSYYVADLLWQTQQLIVEYDSDAFHLTSASHHHDSVRRRPSRTPATVSLASRETTSPASTR